MRGGTVPPVTNTESLTKLGETGCIVETKHLKVVLRQVHASAMHETNERKEKLMMWSHTNPLCCKVTTIKYGDVVPTSHIQSCRHHNAWTKLQFRNM